MLRQKVQNPPLDPLRGLGVVAAALAAAVLGSAIFSRLGERIGVVSSALFILYGIAIAWLLMNRYVLAFSYQAGPDCLRVSRVYGRYERHMVDVWYGSVLAYGTPEAMRARFPGAPVSRATRPGCTIEALAVAHTDGGKTVITVLQPDEKIGALLLGKVKK